MPNDPNEVGMGMKNKAGFRGLSTWDSWEIQQKRKLLSEHYFFSICRKIVSQIAL